MTVKELIESGTLELYVMNILPEDERQNIESLALQHPELKAELAAIEAALQSYAQVNAIAPTIGLKDNILSKIAAETDNTSKVTSEKLADKPPLSYGLLLSGLTAIGLGILSFYFYKKYDESEKALINCKKDNIQIAEKQKVIADLQTKLNIITNNNTKTIELKGLDIAPQSQVTVYWHKEHNATLVTIQDLPQPPQGKQYQLWAIVDKKPVDAGLLTYDKTLIQTMKPFEKPEAFAITLEPEGGSLNPTLDKMYVLGSIN
jgi:anti-sigma-K factor RskA